MTDTVTDAPFASRRVHHPLPGATGALTPDDALGQDGPDHRRRTRHRPRRRARVRAVGSAARAGRPHAASARQRGGRGGRGWACPRPSSRRWTSRSRTRSPPASSASWPRSATSTSSSTMRASPSRPRWCGTDLALWARHLAVNATGPFLLTRAVLPAMLERRWGRIVNIASMAALGGAPYIAAYAASKHALLGLTRAAAAETAGRGVTVNAVCPGYVATDIVWNGARRIAEKTGKPFDDAVAAMAAFNPSGKLIAPETVAAAVLELAGDAAAGPQRRSRGHRLSRDEGHRAGRGTGGPLLRNLDEEAGPGARDHRDRARWSRRHLRLGHRALRPHARVPRALATRRRMPASRALLRPGTTWTWSTRARRCPSTAMASPASRASPFSTCCSAGPGRSAWTSAFTPRSPTPPTSSTATCSWARTAPIASCAGHGATSFSPPSTSGATGTSGSGRSSSSTGSS